MSPLLSMRDVTNREISRSENEAEMVVTLEVVLDNEQSKGSGSSWRAGERLSGKVRVNISGCPAIGGQLTLHIAGTEECWVNHIRHEHMLFSKDVVVRDLFKQTLRPGNYDFPFRLKLPASLPPSKSFEIHKSGFKIHYEVEARLKKKVHTVPLIVKAASLEARCVPRAWGPSAFNVWSQGLVKLGSLSLAVNICNSNLGREDHLEVSLACRNHSCVDIERVEVELFEQMSWTNGNQRRPLITLRNVDLPGLHKRRPDRSNVVCNDVSTNVTPDQQALRDDLRLEQNLLRLNIPSSSLDSYEGELVNISHFLAIQLVTKTHDFSAQIPVRIGSAPHEDGISASFGNLTSSYMQVDAIAIAENQTSSTMNLRIPEARAIPAIKAYSVNNDNVVRL